MAKAALGSGARFAGIANKAAASYEKKGVPAAKAKQIGAAIAAKAGQAKYGVKAMSKMAQKGKK
jgi:hypothetical protein